MVSKNLADVSRLPDDTLFIVKKDPENPHGFTVWAAGYPGPGYEDHNNVLLGACTVEPDRFNHNRTSGMNMEGIEDGLVITKSDVQDKLHLNTVGVDFDATRYVANVIHDNDKVPSEKVQEAALTLSPGIIRHDASPRIQMKAVQLADSPSTVSHIAWSVDKSRQDPEAMGLAVIKCPTVVSELSDSLQDAYGNKAVGKNAMAVVGLNNPSEATVRLALEENPYLVKLAGKCPGLANIPANAAMRAKNRVAAHETKLFSNLTAEGKKLDVGKERVQLYMKVRGLDQAKDVSRQGQAPNSRKRNLEADIEAAKRRASASNPGGDHGNGPGGNMSHDR